MKNNPTVYNLLKLHLIVIIYGFTAILGKLISLSAINLVWYRMLIALAAFLIILKFQKIPLSIKRKDMLIIMGVGVIVAIHWITFFGSIKLSNVSVALGCFASTTLFTSFLEPLFYKKKIKLLEVSLGIIIITGLYVIFKFEFKYWQGIITSIISAFLAGLFTVLNRKLVAQHRARVITLYEMIGGFTALTIFILITQDKSAFVNLPLTSDIIYLLILGIICTAFAFVIQVDVMKQLTAYLVTLTINLEPVYGIILAWIIFGENKNLSTGFFIGTSIILAAVISYPIITWQKNKKLR